MATFTTSALRVGTHSITAVYGGDTNFHASTSAALTPDGQPGGTTTALTSSANPSVFGQSVTFTATVPPSAPGSRHPTGTVTFKDGATAWARHAQRRGVATFTTVDAERRHPLDHGRLQRRRQFDDQHLDGAHPDGQPGGDHDDQLTSSANPSVFGQAVTFTATVTASARAPARPTGTVTFKDGSTTLGTGTLDAGGVASLHHLARWRVGSHTITAVYNGDAQLTTTSTSPPLSQTVNQAATTTPLASSANPSVFGQAVTFTATVTADAPAPGRPPAR